MLRLVFTFLLTGLTGIGIAFGLSALVGLISVYLRLPVFAVVLVWWT
jgi:hypothetical protein